ncbi:MAG: DNA gyrase/topoisomerase IV subunit A [Bacteroidales bacterium]|nr:DNA gyrase/topoisomerase IV subunit A [Bacteroidales bacterium]
MDEDHKNEIEQNTENVENNDMSIISVSGMYKNWFLDYASYVILERAVPHLNDGLKPVQRRILHAMKRLDDGRYNKVANIIGYTMQYHPHGDASIGDALVQLGQKELLIDAQGNWGNTLTGDSAAAPRYIEARLSKFALEVLFNHKTTEWKTSYDGRNQEPINLPVKFPLLLAQGVEGIAVGLASKILPHNFIELIDASIAYLKKQEFELFPDFISGGMIDVSRYNDGIRGGKVKVRAKIEKTDRKTLTITELPFGKTTTTLIESILSANDKGKIKIKKIEDKTSDQVKIIVHIHTDLTPDQAIDALYAFTDCEVSISPNSTVIGGNKPRFLSVTELLIAATNNTQNLLTKELEIEIDELNESHFFSSLEKIFIQNKIYQRIEECTTFEQIIEEIDKGLEPFKKLLIREVTRDDIIKLTEIKIKRISKFDSFKADELLKNLEEKIKQAQYNLDHIVQYTIDYYIRIKEKFGKGKERKTEIRNFDDIIASEVAVANKKLYVNYQEGFAGTELKGAEFLSDCSEIDDVIVFLNNGEYFVTNVQEKFFIGQNVEHIDIFRKNDERTTYNVAYLDGKTGYTYVKRFTVTSIIKDKRYDVTSGSKYSKINYFSANPNAEAETVVVKHKPKARLKKIKFDFDFGELSIRNRSAKGNLLTKHLVHKITIKEKGESTIGGEKRWFDFATLRLKNVEVDQYLGEFENGDKILVARKSGTYRLTTYDLTNHYEPDIIQIEKYNPDKVYNAIYFNAEQGYLYLKRFTFDSTNVEQLYISEEKGSYLVEFTDVEKPFIELIFGGNDKDKDPKILNSDEFLGVKSVAARGKRLSTYDIASAKFITPETDLDELGTNDDEIIDDDTIEEVETNEKKEETKEKKEETKEKKIDFEIKMPDGRQINLDF